MAEKALEYWDVDGNRISIVITLDGNHSPGHLIFNFTKSHAGGIYNCTQKIPVSLIARWDQVLLSQFGLRDDN